MAIAALVLGICSLVFCHPCTCYIGIPCAILAIIFGIIGLKKSKTTGKGKGLALTGLILGCVGAAIATLVLLFVIIAAASAPTYPSYYY